MSRTDPFLPREHFDRGDGSYRLLPFRFLRWSATESLVVNDVGDFLFLDRDDLAALIGGSLQPGTELYRELEARQFLTAETDLSVALELLATRYRTQKSFLEGFTRLHLFVVTLRCDHTCRYCQVSRVNADRTRFDMSEETALRSIDLLFGSPAAELKVEFQGGEPLLAFERIRFVIDEIERRNCIENRRIDFVVASNLAFLTDEMLRYFREHSVCLSTSLDGPAFLHNRNRPRPGRDSHEQTVRGLEQAREVLGHDRVSAVMTTTRASLAHPREIVDEYVRLGFDAIFLRPISPYGFAVKTGEALAYEARQFLHFYQSALERVIELNRQGVPLVEVYTQILLQRMLTPFPTGYVDLQSPAGAGIGAVAYNYDGDVYASDEGRMLAEMGDATFRLGNVHQDSYEQIFGGRTLQELVRSSVLETLPGCAECAFLPYCGADPVFHHATQGELIGHRPTSAFCTRNFETFRYLMGLWREADPFVRELLIRWAAAIPPRAERQPSMEDTAT